MKSIPPGQAEGVFVLTDRTGPVLAEIRSVYIYSRRPGAAINVETAALLDYLTNGGLLVRSELVCY